MSGAPRGSLPAGYMWVNGQIYEAGGRKLTATESRFLLLGDSVTNPNRLRRGSVGVQKTASRWGATGREPQAPDGSVAPTTPPVVRPTSAPQPEEEGKLA